jgi:hypothetical protein
MDGYGTPGYGTVTEHYTRYEELADLVHREMMPFYEMIVDIGKYRLLFLDTRRALRESGTRFPPHMIADVRNAKSSARPDTQFIICLPQPLVHLDVVHAYLQGLAFSDGVDESQHPTNRVGAQDLTKALQTLGTRTFVISGDVHQAFIQDHGSHLTDLVTSGITRETRDALPWLVRGLMWIQRNVSTLQWTTSVHNRRNLVTCNNFGGLRDDQPYIIGAYIPTYGMVE